jgi:hypothetical protein
LVLLKATTSSSKVIVKGKDTALDLTAATLPLNNSATVTAQVSNSDNNNCWEGTFPTTSFKKNTDAQFKAKSP